MRRLALLLSCASVVGLLAAPGARADVRSGTVSDPVDAQPQDNGDGTSTPSPDIQQVDLDYDTAGRISARIHYYDPLPEYDFDPLSFDVGRSCATFDAAGDAHVTVETDRSDFGELDESWVTGVPGNPALDRSLSDDGRTLSVVVDDPSLADRGYTCVSPPTQDGDSAAGFKLYGPGGATYDIPLSPSGTAPGAGASPGSGAGTTAGHARRLTLRTARRLIKLALRRRYPSFRHGHRRRIDHCRHSSPSRVRCGRIAWRTKHAGFAGHGAVRYRRQDGWSTPHSSFRIKRVA